MEQQHSGFEQVVLTMNVSQLVNKDATATLITLQLSIGTWLGSQERKRRNSGQFLTLNFLLGMQGELA